MATKRCAPGFAAYLSGFALPCAALQMKRYAREVSRFATSVSMS